MAFITNTVGLGARNLAADVKIIQWMLQTTQYYYGLKVFKQGYSIPEDGSLDPDTNNAITDVVNYCRASGSSDFSFSNGNNPIFPAVRIISPDDQTYQFLIKCSIKPLCVPCSTSSTITFADDSVVRQAINDQINFITFRHIAETRDKLKDCLTLTKAGLEAREQLKDPRVRAFLDTIAMAEGWFNEDLHNGHFTHRPVIYDEISGWIKVDDISEHPNRKGKWSRSAGPYEFMPFDWANAKKDTGLTDFTPESQEIAAVHLLITRNNIIGAILNNDILEAIQRACGTWASFPDRNISKNGDVNNFPASHHKGQNAAPANELIEVYNRALSFYQKK